MRNERMSLEDRNGIGSAGWDKRVREASDCELDEFLGEVDHESRRVDQFERPLTHRRLREAMQDLVKEKTRRELIAKSYDQGIHMTDDEKATALFLLRKQLRLDVLEGRGEKAAGTIEQLIELMAEVKALDNQYGEGWL